MLSDKPVRQTAIWAVVSFFIVPDSGGTIANSRTGQELRTHLQDAVFLYIRRQNRRNDPDLDPQNVGRVRACIRSGQAAMQAGPRAPFRV